MNFYNPSTSYTATVASFTDPLITLSAVAVIPDNTGFVVSGQITDNGTPAVALPGLIVKVTNHTQSVSSYGYTDASGNFSAFLSKYTSGDSIYLYVISQGN